MPPRVVGPCAQVADVVFAIDTSSNLDPNYLQTVLNFVVAVCNYFPIEKGSISVGVVAFGATQQLDVQLGLYQSFPELVAAINKV